jgi:hypothetical protein
MKNPLDKHLNIIWSITEQEYDLTNEPSRKIHFTNQRYSFWMVVRRLLPSVSYAATGDFTARKNGKPETYDHATVINGLNAAKLNYERTDYASLQFVEVTETIYNKCFDLIGGKKSQSKIKQRYRKGIDNLNKSYKKLRMLQSKANQTDDNAELLRIKVLMDICNRKIESKTINYKQRRQTTQQRLDYIWTAAINKFHHNPTPKSNREDVLFRMAFHHVAKITIPLVTLDTLGEFAASKLEIRQYNHSTIFHALEESRKMFGRRDEQSMAWCVKVRELIESCKKDEKNHNNGLLIVTQNYRLQASRSLKAHRDVNARHFINRQMLIK